MRRCRTTISFDDEERKYSRPPPRTEPVESHKQKTTRNETEVLPALAPTQDARKTRLMDNCALPRWETTKATYAGTVNRDMDSNALKAEDRTCFIG